MPSSSSLLFAPLLTPLIYFHHPPTPVGVGKGIFFRNYLTMSTGRRDSSPARLALALPSIWKKVRYRWSPHRVNSVDLGASTGSLSEALVYPWIAHQPSGPPDGRPRSLSCQLPGPPLRELWFIFFFFCVCAVLCFPAPVAGQNVAVAQGIRSCFESKDMTLQG